jgi:ankyrin repeat protein
MLPSLARLALRQDDTGPQMSGQQKLTRQRTSRAQRHSALDDDPPELPPLRRVAPPPAERRRSNPNMSDLEVVRESIPIQTELLAQVNREVQTIVTLTTQQDVVEDRIDRVEERMSAETQTTSTDEPQWLRDASEELARMQSTVNILDARINEATRQIEFLMLQLAEEKRASSVSIAALREEVNTYKGLDAESKVMKDQLTKALADCEEGLDELRLEGAQNFTHYRTINEQNERCREQNARLRRRIEELETRLEQNDIEPPDPNYDSEYERTLERLPSFYDPPILNQDSSREFAMADRDEPLSPGREREYAKALERMRSTDDNEADSDEPLSPGREREYAQLRLKRMETLFRAAKEGDLKMVQKLLRRGVNPDDTTGWQNWRTTTALMEASERGYTEIVEALLAAGADVNMKDKHGYTALIYASLGGHTEIVKLFLAIDGIDVNWIGTWATALTKASGYGHTDIVKMLLAAGADVNLAASDGETALIKASENGKADVVEVLLKWGANVDAIVQPWGRTALMVASALGHADVVAALLKGGADVNQATIYGNTALMVASRGRTDIVKVLLAASADVNREDKYGNTALKFASKKGHTEIVTLLLAAGADVNKAGEDGWTALMYASLNGHTAIVKLLLDTPGIKVNTVNDGWTAPMLASKQGHAEIIALFKAAQKKGKNSGGGGGGGGGDGGVVRGGSVGGSRLGLGYPMYGSRRR